MKVFQKLFFIKCRRTHLLSYLDIIYSPIIPWLKLMFIKRKKRVILVFHLFSIISTWFQVENQSRCNFRTTNLFHKLTITLRVCSVLPLTPTTRFALACGHGPNILALIALYSFTKILLTLTLENLILVRS